MMSVGVGKDEKFWIAGTRRINATPRARIYCFAHAGANGFMFAEWVRSLPDDVEILGAQLPGRGQRMNEPPPCSIEEVTSELVQVLERAPASPMILFGHSFGGVVAFELARALEQSGQVQVSALIISSCPAPHRPPKRDFLLHTLPRGEFFAELHKVNGIPREVLESERLQAMVEPPLRADIKCREIWLREVADRKLAATPLSTPIFPMGGRADRFVTRKDLADWGMYTHAPRPVRLFKGGHFYFHEDPATALKAIADIVESVT